MWAYQYTRATSSSRALPRPPARSRVLAPIDHGAPRDIFRRRPAPRPVQVRRRRLRDRGRAGFTAARRGGRVGRFTPCRASMANTSCWNVTDLFQRALQLRPPRGPLAEALGDFHLLPNLPRFKRLLLQGGGL